MSAPQRRRNPTAIDMAPLGFILYFTLSHLSYTMHNRAVFFCTSFVSSLLFVSRLILCRSLEFVSTFQVINI
jgi:hypothetical protein